MNIEHHVYSVQLSKWDKHELHVLSVQHPTYNKHLMPNIYKYSLVEKSLFSRSNNVYILQDRFLLLYIRNLAAPHIVDRLREDINLYRRFNSSDSSTIHQSFHLLSYWLLPSVQPTLGPPVIPGTWPRPGVRFECIFALVERG